MRGKPFPSFPRRHSPLPSLSRFLVRGPAYSLGLGPSPLRQRFSCSFRFPQFLRVRLSGNRRGRNHPSRRNRPASHLTIHLCTIRCVDGVLWRPDSNFLVWWTGKLSEPGCKIPLSLSTLGCPALGCLRAGSSSSGLPTGGIRLAGQLLEELRGTGTGSMNLAESTGPISSVI